MASSIIDVPVGTTADELQRVINFAPDGAVIRLAEGTHYFDETIEIYQDNLTFIGAGEDKTIIVMDNEDHDAPVIQVGHRLFNPVVASWTDLKEWAYQGETKLTVWNTDYLDVGDVVYIAAENTAEFFEEIGDTQWQKENPLRTIMAEIIDIDGDTIEIDTPLTFDFDPSLTTVEERWVVDNVTLSGFTVQGPYGEANDNNYKNTKDGLSHSMILAAGTRDLTVTDIKIEDSISHGLTVADTIDAEVSNIEIDGAHNKGTGGNGYGVWIRDTYDSRFTELDIVDVRHAVLFASYTSASGNYVHVNDTNRDINFHGGRDQFNTVEVDIMRVDDAGSNAPGKEVFFNEGEFYGAPTDASLNSVTVRSLVSDVSTQFEVEYGGRIKRAGDEIFTGEGDDYTHGTGKADTIYGSEGDDSVDGGLGADVLVLPGLRSDYTVTQLDGDLYFDRSNDTTWVQNVEEIRFRDETVTADALFAIATLEKKDADDPDEAVEGAGEIGPEDPDPDTGGGDTGGDTGGGGDGGADDTSGATPATHLGWDAMDVSWLDVLAGTDGYDGLWMDSSSKFDGLVEDASMSGTAHFVAVGNPQDNKIYGNTGDNRIEGRNGNDKVLGKAGNDTLLGGKGDDELDGGSDNDMLDGGQGNDTIEGGTGDDTIRASAGTDWIDGERGDFDAILFDAVASDMTVTMEDDDIYMFTHTDGVTYTEDVEIFAFSNAAYTLDQIDQWVATGVAPDVDVDDPDSPDPVFDFNLVAPL